MEIVSKRSYGKNLYIISLIIFSGLVLIYLWYRENVFVYIGLFVVIELILLSRKFVCKISITEDQLVIIYRQWFVEKIKQFKLSDIHSRVASIVANKAGSTYLKLNIYNQKFEIIFSIKSDEGFDEEDLKIISNIISRSEGL